MRNILCVIAIVLVSVSILSVSACTNTSAPTAETKSSTQQSTSSKPEEMPSATSLPEATSTDTGTDPLARLYRDLDSYRPPENYSFEITTVKGPDNLPENNKFKLYFKGKRNKQMLVINDKVRTTTYTYEDEGRIYVLMNPGRSPQTFGTREWKNDPGPDAHLSTMLIGDTERKYKDLKIVGTENLDGKVCTIYSYDKGPFLEKYWIENENIVFRKYEKTNNDILIAGVYINNYTIGNVTDEMLTLPNDAVVIDVPPSTPPILPTSTATAKRRAQ